MKQHGLTPRAVIVDSEWSALDPSIMGLGPVLCATAILRRHGLALGDIGLWELNEAFAAQVLACLAAWQDETFCREALASRARQAASSATSSTWTAGRSGSVIRSAPAATASCCIWSTR